MSRDKNYQRLLNSKRWIELRSWYLSQHPLCERCIEEGEAAGVEGGYIRSAVDVHHKIPCESSKSLHEMEQLAFNADNLQALCIPCHIKTHQEQRSHTRDAHKQRVSDRLERWKMRHDKNITKP